MKIASKELTDEYNMLVDILDDQIARLEKVAPESVALDRYRNAYFKIDQGMNEREVRKMRNEVREIVNSDLLSVEGQERAKANALKTLHEEGYTFVNKRNFNSFMRFLDDARARFIHKSYTSEQILEEVNKARQKGLSKKDIVANMEYWKKQNIRTDREGKIIVIENPKPLKLTRKRNK